MPNSQNTIERKIDINAPIDKVWMALTNVKQFGQWFGVNLESDFILGKTTYGRNTTKGYEMKMEFHIKEMKPKTYFSYSWIPFPIDETIDYSKEKPTLVEFFLEIMPSGTRLTVKESGFTNITASRRAQAFKMHTQGWEAQLKNIEEFVGK